VGGNSKKNQTQRRESLHGQLSETGGGKERFFQVNKQKMADFQTLNLKGEAKNADPFNGPSALKKMYPIVGTFDPGRRFGMVLKNRGQNNNTFFSNNALGG